MLNEFLISDMPTTGFILAILLVFVSFSFSASAQDSVEAKPKEVVFKVRKPNFEENFKSDAEISWMLGGDTISGDEIRLPFWWLNPTKWFPPKQKQ